MRQRIGIIAIVFGGLLILAALPNLAFALLGLPAPELVVGMPAPFDTMWKYRGLLSGVQLALGLTFLLAGFAARRGRPWARLALELCLWLILIVYFVFGALAYRGRSTGSDDPLWDAMPEFALAVIGFWSLVFVALIVYLRSRRVRGEFTATRSSP